MKTVVLISCTKSKRKYPCPARLMYDAPRSKFKKTLPLAQTMASDENIFVISAKHGLLPLEKVIEYYDYTLMGKSDKIKNEWGKLVAGQISELYDVSSTKFIILAGKDYYAPLQPYLPNVELPLQGLSSGRSLSKINELLRESGRR